MLSATASLGLILLWDLDGGLSQIDKYLYSHEDNIKVIYFNANLCFKTILNPFYYSTLKTNFLHSYTGEKSC